MAWHARDKPNLSYLASFPDFYTTPQFLGFFLFFLPADLQADCRSRATLCEATSPQLSHFHGRKGTRQRVQIHPLKSNTTVGRTVLLCPESSVSPDSPAIIGCRIGAAASAPRSLGQLPSATRHRRTVMQAAHSLLLMWRQRRRKWAVVWGDRVGEGKSANELCLCPPPPHHKPLCSLSPFKESTAKGGRVRLHHG